MLAEVCARLAIAPRLAEALLSVSVALSLIQCHEGRYALTPLAKDHLLNSSSTSFERIGGCVLRQVFDGESETGRADQYVVDVSNSRVGQAHLRRPCPTRIPILLQ
jgi:hypothetical protein